MSVYTFPFLLLHQYPKLSQLLHCLHAELKQMPFMMGQLTITSNIMLRPPRLNQNLPVVVCNVKLCGPTEKELYFKA